MAPAKVNLTLEVLGRREDGFHTLRSVMVPIGLYDRIEFEEAAVGRFRVSVAAVGRSCASAPELESDNLVVRALAAAGVRESFDVVLEKVIPVGGGLGGGSSDAAAVLRAAMEGTLGACATQDWVAAAASLGSDVPFFLAGTGALVEGTGERVTALGALPPWWVVVARPHASVATGAAYRVLDEARMRGGGPVSRPRATSASLVAVDALQRGDFAALAAGLVNDFHDLVVAQYPAVARANAALHDAGARHALLSGSGSCLFALFECEAEARACERRVDPAAVEALFAVPLHQDGAWR